MWRCHLTSLIVIATIIPSDILVACVAGRIDVWQKVASSRRSVSWGAARKKAREEIKKKGAKGSERTPMGKL